jgi:hypothetical protein
MNKINWVYDIFEDLTASAHCICTYQSGTTTLVSDSLIEITVVPQQ